MWLQPLISTVSRLTIRTYYRLRVEGATVPPRGPVLVVANHPNSLLDPGVVALAAGRPLRFLAKAPLFRDPLVGWMVRGFGSLPVYRAQDDPSQMGQNEDTFRAVFQALREESAVGIFPEGISHSEPSLARLKTGAARIVLGAHEAHGTETRLVPMGLSFRAKNIFRSEAVVVVGEPIAWQDLLEEPDPIARAQTLTSRIEQALRNLTLNLERWEDEPVVRTAEEIYRITFPVPAGERERLERLRQTTELLARVRREEDPEGMRLIREVAGFGRKLRVLGLELADLERKPGAGATFRWGVRNAPYLGFFPSLVTLLGLFFFYLPYQLPGWLMRRSRPSHDVESTYKLLTGTAIFLVWFLLFAALATSWRGWGAGLATLVVLPTWAWLTLLVRDRWKEAGRDAFRFFRLRRHDEIRRRLLQERQGIATRLEALRARLGVPEGGSAGVLRKG